MNRLRAEGKRTTLEEKQLSTDGVVDRYTKVWDTLKFHNFYIFTKSRDLYVPSLVCEFSFAYGKAIPKVKNRVKVALKPLDVVEVQGVQVLRGEIEINDILGCKYKYKNKMDEMMKVKTFDGIKAWLAHMIGIQAPSWLKEGAIIERRK